MEGDNIDGGDELRGENPKSLSGVHGETERAQIRSGEEDWRTITFGVVLIVSMSQRPLA